MHELATAVHPALRALLDAAGDAPILDIAAARAARRMAAVQRGGPAAPVRDVVDVVEAPVRLRMYEPYERVAAAPLVVIHGGGWVWGGIDEVDPLARALAIATGRLTASVGYRLAPEHPFPAALDDVTAAIAWLREHATQRDSAADVALLGLSAGGNLATAVSARLPETVAAQVLVYPMLDPSLSSESAHRYALAAPLSRARATWFWDQYAPGPVRGDPAAAPALTPDVAGLPPTRVVLAEVDVLRDEGLAYAERLRAAAVPVSTRVWPGMVHGFLAMAGLVPGTCAAAVADIADWLAEPARNGTTTP